MGIRDIEEVKKAVADSFSLASVLRKLNIAVAGGNYQSLKNVIKRHQINTSHFTGMGHTKGKTLESRKRPIEHYLKDDKLCSTYALKNRLLKEGLKEHKCENCKLSTWLENPIPLELHHVDGNKYNNLLINIQLLCPNCHAQTDNYRGKAKQRRKVCKNKESATTKVSIKPEPTGVCLRCNSPTYRKLKYCSHVCCTTASRKVERPSKEELQALIDKHNWLQLSRMFGVSDNAIRKWAKQYGIIT